MKVALIGATGYVGSRVMIEALRRGHQVTAMVRRPERLPQVPQLEAVRADVFDGAAMAALVAGHDAVIDAFHPGWGSPASGERQLLGAQTIIGAVRQAAVARLLLVGNAGTLTSGAAGDLLDSVGYLAAMKPAAYAARAVLRELRGQNSVQWTVLTPPATLEPGTRTGTFRLDDDSLIRDHEGVSGISLEDYAVAMIDELENPRYLNQRFTIGY
jgi:uncharacterized protein